eukprot:scaffold22492_cov138-Skeletonema_menzelii.AAC.29
MKRGEMIFDRRSAGETASSGSSMEKLEEAASNQFDGGKAIIMVMWIADAVVLGPWSLEKGRGEERRL